MFVHLTSMKFVAWPMTLIFDSRCNLTQYSSSSYIHEYMCRVSFAYVNILFIWPLWSWPRVSRKTPIFKILCSIPAMIYMYTFGCNWWSLCIWPLWPWPLTPDVIWPQILLPHIFMSVWYEFHLRTSTFSSFDLFDLDLGSVVKHLSSNWFLRFYLRFICMILIAIDEFFAFDLCDLDLWPQM